MGEKRAEKEKRTIAGSLKKVQPSWIALKKNEKGLCSLPFKSHSHLLFLAATLRSHSTCWWDAGFLFGSWKMKGEKESRTPNAAEMLTSPPPSYSSVLENDSFEDITTSSSWSLHPGLSLTDLTYCISLITPTQRWLDTKRNLHECLQMWLQDCVGCSLDECLVIVQF